MTTPSVLASDTPGSSLTVAFQDWEQDSATRKFLVNANNRATAITTLIDWLDLEDGADDSDGDSHPNISKLLVNNITCQAAGPERWILVAQYRRRKSGGFPSSYTLANMRMSFEGLEVFCDTTQFKDGLPFGKSGTAFVHPGYYGGTDPNSKPQPWIYNKPVMQVQQPFSSLTNPMVADVEVIGNVNISTKTIGGHDFQIGELRFDGTDMQSKGPSDSGLGGATKFTGTRNFTFRLGGWYKQVIEWDADLGSWQAENRKIATNTT